MRAGFVLVVLAAVVVPTAVLGNAPSGRGFSVQQVLRVFKAEGVPLQRDTGGPPAAGYETFDAVSPNQGFVSVAVWRPGYEPAAEGMFTLWTGQPPRSAQRGNVQVALSAPGSERMWHRVLAALRKLHYSLSDAARPELPTILLHAGQRLLLTPRQAPNGSEVDCANGSVIEGLRPQPIDVAIAIDADTRRSGAYAASGNTTPKDKTLGAKLRWTPEGRGSLAFACSSWTPPKHPGPGMPNGAPASSYYAEGMAGVAPQFPTSTGPLPPLKLPRLSFTLHNEYANVPARTLRAMLGR